MYLFDVCDVLDADKHIVVPGVGRCKYAEQFNTVKLSLAIIKKVNSL